MTRKRGAQLRNLNAARLPWRSFWKRRALRVEDRWVLPVLADYAEGLATDKGGVENCSAAELRMIEVAQVARGCSMLILSNAARAGFTRDIPLSAAGAATWTLAPGVGELGKFLSIERAALQSIGLERRARPVPSLAEILAAREQGQDGSDDEQNGSEQTVTTEGTGERSDNGPNVSLRAEQGGGDNGDGE